VRGKEQVFSTLISCPPMRMGGQLVPVSSVSFKPHFPSLNALPGQTETMPPQPPRASPMASHNRNELSALFLLFLRSGITSADPASGFSICAYPK